MNTKLTFCALALLATMVAAEAFAQNYRPYRTTVHKLTDTAELVITAELDRVEDVQINEPGHDATRHKSVGDGSLQDGEEYIRREGVLKVGSVLKGAIEPGTEVRFISIRQLKLNAYKDSLRSGEALWFLRRREHDGRFIVLADERGAITASDAGGDLQQVSSFVKDHLALGSTSTGRIDATLDAITLDGSRLSQDCSYELSWYHEDYAENMTEEQRQRIMSLMKLSPVDSIERNQLITAVGRHSPEGALMGLMEVMFNDPSWSTTSLASMSLEYVDRGAAIEILLGEWPTATELDKKTVIVRSLGLIRPKHGFDGEEVRNATLELVSGLLTPETDAGLLREALIASRDLRSGDAHVEELKALIDNRDSNGLGDAEVKAAIIALAAAREDIKTEEGHNATRAIAEDYLKELAESDAVLEQVVKSALGFPWTTLIVGADGKGH